MTFAFYDLETTGLSPAFDQPLQFAAILTDDHFREIERVNLRCRIAPHIIPSPWALAVTGVRPAQLLDPALPTLFEFTQEVGSLIDRWSPATWTGFNSIRFDEEVLRQAFYQNLQPDIFATQFNGNTRFDVLTALYAVWHRQPDLFDWPVDETGRVRFKLDRLAPLNGFTAHNAHDALGDVEATIHIARLIAERAPRLWAELLGNREKAQVQARLEAVQPMALVERFGGGLPRATLGCFCGYAQGNGSQAGFFDLEAADPSDLLTASDDALFAAVDNTPKIIRGIATNKAPALLEIREPSAEHLRRAAIIADAPEFRRRVGAAMAARFAEDPDAPPKPVEKQIYGAFYSHADKKFLHEFQRSGWPRRQEIIASFSDPRLRQLGQRLIAFHSPALLSAEEMVLFRGYLREKWNAPDSSEAEWMTFGKAKAAIHELRAQAAVEPAMREAIVAFVEDLRAHSLP